MQFVTIDSGTTNTRIRIWQNNQVIAEAQRSVGVRDTAITGSTKKLTEAVKDALFEALNKANIKTYDDLFIIASGMITSNVGLCEIPHLIAPVSIDDLSKGMVNKILPEIIDHPIWFVPGVKNHVEGIDLNNCEMMDIMRGEETEFVGVSALLELDSAALVILPGSHSKFVKVNEHNQIAGCMTTLAGELLDTITQNTILANSLEHKFANSIEEEYLLKGAHYCHQVGIARSCFSVRILDLFSDLTTNQKANFLLGVVLSSDILAIKNSKALACDEQTKIVICGKKTLREAFYLLLKNDAFFKGNILVFEEEMYPSISGIGAIHLAKQRITLE